VEARTYRVLAKALAALPPGLGEFGYANWVYRHRLQRLPRHSAVRVELKGGPTFDLDVSEWPQAQAFLLGRYAPDVVRFIVGRLTRDGSTFLDVGAHVGLVSFQVAALARPRKPSIHAFEPHPDAARSLRANHGLNPHFDVRVNECAVSEHPGSVKLNLRRYCVEEGVREDEDIVAVPALVLDEYLDAAGIDYADVVKLDVEGHELHALKGARRALAEGRIGYVVVEMLDDHYARLGISPLDLVAFMSRHGYVRTPLPRVGPRRARGRGKKGGGDFVFARSRPPENGAARRR
jgi:FkbM family methyltransferase